MAGDHLATVIPSADLKVVAGFPPSDALARVRQGQPAQMRLDGFPWTEFGSHWPAKPVPQKISIGWVVVRNALRLL